MSGRKQHFIPQSLLRGFGVQRGRSTFVVAYTRDRGVFSPATDGIAAERHFYSELAVKGELDTLDDRITAYETPFATALAGLRALGDGEAADGVTAAELVTHLAVRNDHFRKTMGSAGASVMRHAAGMASQADRLRSMFGLDGDEPSEFFAGELAKAFAERRELLAMVGMDEKAFGDFAFALLQQNFEAYHGEIGPEVAAAVSSLIGEVPSIAANAQRGSLGKELAPELRVKRMAEMNWHVHHVSYPVILPDCVTLGVDHDGAAAPLMFVGLDGLARVHLPLASDRVLAGAVDGAPAAPPTMNEIAAGCSWDFFVARDRLPEFEALRGTLRARVSRVIDDLVEGAVREL
jgi:hypothetical protein